MLIRILPVWRFVHGTPNALRSPVQESPTKIIQGGRVTGPATWPYSRHTGLVIFAQRQEDEMGVIRPSGRKGG